MIKILTIDAKENFQLHLTFSNHAQGMFDGGAYLADRSGLLLEPLRDVQVFQGCFIEAGALCWPNGLELSAQRVLELCKLTQSA